MKKTLTLMLTAAALAASAAHAAPAQAQRSAAKKAQKAPNQAERNKANALAFYEMTFNQHKVQEATDLYIGKEYLQHNPTVADGGQAFADAFAPFLKENPQRKAAPKSSV